MSSNELAESEPVWEKLSDSWGGWKENYSPNNNNKTSCTVAHQFPNT